MKTDSEAVAKLLHAEHHGEKKEITNVASLDAGGEGTLSFCGYDSRDYVEESDSDVIIAPSSFENLSQTLIVHPKPRLAYAKVANENLDYDSVIKADTGISEQADIAESAQIGHNVTIGDNVEIGENTVIRSGAVIGAQGAGWARDSDNSLIRIPHLGGVRIGDDVEIGANTTIDQGVFNATVVGDGVKISSHVHLAHQSLIGQDTFISTSAAVAGGATVGESCEIHPQAAIANDVSIGDECTIGLNSTVFDDVDDGQTVIGSPRQIQY